MKSSTFPHIRIFAAITIVLGFGIFIYTITVNRAPCPLPDYASYHGYPEDLLILEGECVVPTVIEAIHDRRLAKRPFLISFLGNGSFKAALEPLVAMVEDETEPNRSVALIAVFQIDSEKGRQLAAKYAESKGELGEISQDILADKEYLHDRKSYLEAWRSYIDVTYAL